MFQLIKFGLSTISIALLLAGCGATVNDASSDVSNSSNNQEQQTNSDESNLNSEKLPLVRLLEQKIKYFFAGQLKEESAFIQSSDNQNFSMYVLPSFDLTAEEPRKDILYLKKNDNIFMRIELLSADTNIELINETTLSQLQAVNDDVKIDIIENEDEFLHNAIRLHTENDTDILTAYIIQSNQVSVKLMMFTTKEMEYEDAFLQMAKTILPMN